MSLPTAKKLLVRTPQKLLTDALMRLFQERGRGLGEGLRREIPGHWEKHGDLVLLPDTAFVSEDWKMFGRFSLYMYLYIISGTMSKFSELV